MEEVAAARAAMDERGRVSLVAFDPHQPVAVEPGRRLLSSVLPFRGATEALWSGRSGPYRQVNVGPGQRAILWNPSGEPRCVETEPGGSREVPAGQHPITSIASFPLPPFSSEPLAVIWISDGFEDWLKPRKTWYEKWNANAVLGHATLAGITVFPLLLNAAPGVLQRAETAASLFGGRVFRAGARPGDGLRAARAHIDRMQVLRVQANPEKDGPGRLDNWLSLRARDGTKLRRGWFAPASDEDPRGPRDPLKRILVLAGEATARVGHPACPAGDEEKRHVGLRVPKELEPRLRAPLRLYLDYLADEAGLAADGPFLQRGAMIVMGLDSMVRSLTPDAVICMPVGVPHAGQRFRVRLQDGQGERALVAAGRFPAGR
jgi:hypothetical protein